MSDVSDLLERLEKATEGSRGLSDAVLFAAGWRINYGAEQLKGLSPEDLADAYDGGCWYPPGEKFNWIHGHLRPDPTRSLDAAMTLLEPGVEYEISTLYGLGHATVGLNLSDEGGPWSVRRKDGNVILALVTAALKSRSPR